MQAQIREDSRAVLPYNEYAYKLSSNTLDFILDKCANLHGLRGGWYPSLDEYDEQGESACYKCYSVGDALLRNPAAQLDKLELVLSNSIYYWICDIHKYGKEDSVSYKGNFAAYPTYTMDDEATAVKCPALSKEDALALMIKYTSSAKNFSNRVYKERVVPLLFNAFEYDPEYRAYLRHMYCEQQVALLFVRNKIELAARLPDTVLNYIFEFAWIRPAAVGRRRDEFNEFKITHDNKQLDDPDAVGVLESIGETLNDIKYDSDDDSGGLAEFAVMSGACNMRISNTVDEDGIRNISASLAASVSIDNMEFPHYSDREALLQEMKEEAEEEKSANA